MYLRHYEPSDYRESTQFVLINKVTWVIDEVSAVVVSDISEDRKTGVIEAPQSSDLD